MLSRITRKLKRDARRFAKAGRTWQRRTTHHLTTNDLSNEEFINFAYQFILRRDPDESGKATFTPIAANGPEGRRNVLETIRMSDEARHLKPVEPLLALHLVRCDFVRTFPKAAQILDLGGTAQNNRDGALVVMGYRHRFDRLTIVDLPPQDRHESFSHSEMINTHDTPMGTVAYQYHSMVDLSRYPDASIDLVYSGQTIEHVDPAVAPTVLAEAFRVLKPGAALYLDTPNGPVCRLHQADFINPDHHIEYSHDEMAKLIADAGFRIARQFGMINLERSVEAGRVIDSDIAQGYGIADDPCNGYLLAYECRKPVGASSTEALPD